VDSPSVQIPPSLPQLGQTQMDRSLVSSIVWTGVIKWAAQLLSWVATLVVARLLTPDDYGLFAMATVYIGFVGLLNEFGLGSAVVTIRNLDERQVAQLNSVAVIIGLTGFVLSCLLAVPIALFYRVPQLREVVIVMSATFVLSAFRSIPYALLQKDLKFKVIAQTEGLQTLITSLAMVGFGLLGFRHWTLVLGALLGTAVGTLLMWTARPYHFAFPRLRAIREAITLSQQLLVSRICWYVYSNSDFLVAGRVLGKAPLGAYTFAWTLASMPLEKFTGLINQVTPAFLSAVQTDKPALRRYLLTLTEAQALLAFPLAFGLGLTAPDLVPVVLGSKWESVIAPCQWLAFYGAFRAVSPLIANVMMVVGESRFLMLNGLVAVALFPPAFYFGSAWGTVGIAAVWLWAHPLVTIPMFWRAFRRIELRFGDYLRALWPSLTSGLSMILAVLLLQHNLPAALGPGLRLCLEILVGAATYGGGLLCFHRDRLAVFYGFIMKSRAVPAA